MEKTQEETVQGAAKLPTIPPPVARYPPVSSHGSVTSINSEADSESPFGLSKKEIERLGRVRPQAFKSSWSEVGFVLSICMAQLLTVCDNLILYYSNVLTLTPRISSFTPEAFFILTGGRIYLSHTARLTSILPCIKIVNFTMGVFIG